MTAPSAANVGLNQDNWMTAVAAGLTMPLIMVARPAYQLVPHRRPRPGEVIFGELP